MLPDIQNMKDERGVEIDWVGISGYKIPFQIPTKEGNINPAVGTVKMMTDLGKDGKGVNMSRFSSVIEKGVSKGLMSTDLLVDMLTACRDVLGNKNSYVIISFDYFIKKKSPTTEHHSHFTVPCNFCGVLKDGEIKVYLETVISYTSLCPCSKEISQYSAHNQKSTATIRVRFKNLKNYIWIEDIVSMVEEKAASCPIWNLLKREDEKYVTERAYENPKFVEDAVRDLSLTLDNYSEVDGYRITINHEESIHQHTAIAKISKGF